jgi:hypothetical protein
MKHILAGLIIILFIASFSLIVSASETIKPQITIFPELVDIGKIGSTQVKEYHLTVQNDGNANLSINSIITDCPCTTFQYLTPAGTLQTDIPTTIPPGAKIELKLIFDANKTKHVGAFKKIVIINSNDPDEPMKRVRMAGEIDSIDSPLQ